MKPDRKINIRQLEVFIAVVKHQGYGGAQQALNLTSSAISNYMSELEEHVGFVLCQRGRSGFSLTEKGQQYLRQVERLMSEIAELERNTEALKGDMGGVLRLAVLDATVMDESLSLPSIIAQFHDAFPSVHLNLLIRSPHEQMQGILNNELDLAIGNYPTSVNNVVEEKLYREQHWLYCSRSHPLFYDNDLSAEKVTRVGVVTRSYWNQADLRKRGFGHTTATVENMEAQLALILSGKYVGYLPEYFAAQYMKDGILRPLMPTEFGYQAPFSLIIRRGRSRELFIRTIRELLVKQTAKQAK